jgi:VanZ family protein
MRFSPVWYLVGSVLLAAVVVGSLVPIPKVESLRYDKVIHFLVYFSLMGWFGQLGKHRFWLAVAFVSLGIVLEYLQGQTRYRSFEWLDVAANSAGIAIAWLGLMTPLGRTIRWLDSHLQAWLGRQ